MKSYSSPIEEGLGLITWQFMWASTGDWWGGGRVMSWCRWRRPWKQTLRCQRCQSSQAEHEWKSPPTTPCRLASVLCLFFVLTCFPVFPSTSVPWNITAGQKSPSLRSVGLHNENKWAGSKYAVCVLGAHYTSQAIGFHQKLRWIVSPSAHINAF